MDPKEVIAANLRRLRDLRGISQAQLAEAAEISRVQLGDLERGMVESPRSSTLSNLAQALAVPLGELMRPAANLRQVRFRSNDQLKSRDSIISDVARWLSDFNQLEESLAEKVPYPLGDAASEISLESMSDRMLGVQKLAGLTRRKLGLQSREPIFNICGLLESHGVKVYPIRLHNPDFFGLSVGIQEGGPAVIVNTWEKISVERWIFSTAHELGHLQLHLNAYDVSQVQEDEQQEKEADVFASNFLMPQEGFERLWNSTYGAPFMDRVMRVKRVFYVSYATVLMRLVEHPRLAKGNPFARFFADYKRSTGRSLGKVEEPDGISGATFRMESLASKEPEHLGRFDFQENRLQCLVRKAIEEGEISMGRGAEILRIPLTEMRSLMASWS